MFGSDAIDPLKFQITEVSNDMSNADYHARDEISSSFVKTVSKHSIGRALAPQPAEVPKAFLFGDAFHGAMELGDIDWDRFVQTPDESMSSYAAGERLIEDFRNKFNQDIPYDFEKHEGIAVKPDGLSLATKEGKEWKSKNSDKLIVYAKDIENIKSTIKKSRWDNEHGSKIQLTPNEITSVNGMVDSIYKNPFFKPYKNNARLNQCDEWSYFAEGDCEHTAGLRFRVRPDVLFQRKNDGSIEIIFDYKSCIEIAKLTKWQFFDFGYDIQAVFYADVLGVDPRKFVFLAVEKEAPWASRAIRLTEDSIENARYKLISVLNRIKEWKANPSDRRNIDIVLPDLIEL